MTDTRWRRVEELFDLVVELPAGARDDVLGRECGDDHALADEVRSLLVHDADARPALQRRIAEAAGAIAADPPAARVGSRLGPYRLLDVIGEGGMGTVYLAERDDAAYRRRVAIKVLRDGLGSSEATARFRDERQILASLDHPAIVRLLDGGTTEAGLPYLVLEHVDGVPITRHARGLSVRATVELMVRVCGAVQHAHQQLVVHRDLKPGNILIDAAGAPKLLDFGIAKLLDQRGEREARTRTGALLFTVEYASPEQTRGEPVSVATDVYALGAVLYALVTGAPPQRTRATTTETLRAICEDDPPRPSVAAPAARRRELAGDLDNIVMKALQKAPAARYASVAALADDLRRHLDGQPVAARAATFTYRAGKFARRHRAALAIATLVAAALSTATVVSIVQARRANEQAGVARRQTAVAGEQTRVAEEQTRSLLVEQAQRELAAGRASRALPYLAEVLRRGEDTPALRVLLAEAMRPLEQQVGETVELREGIMNAEISADGALVVVSAYDGLHAFDRDLRQRTVVDDVASHIHLDGDRVVVWNARGTDERALTDLVPGARWAFPGQGRATILDTAGGRMLLGTEDGLVWVIDRATGARVLELRIAGGISPAIARDGRTVFVGRTDGVIERHEIGGRGAVVRVTSGPSLVTGLRTTRDGRVISGAADGSVRVWDGATLRPLATLLGHTAYINAMTIDPTERLLATGDHAGVTQVWDLDGGRLLATPPAHRHGVRHIAFGPDGARLVTTGGDNTFRVSEARTGLEEMVIESFAAAGDAPGSVGGALRAWFTPDGSRLLTVSGTELKLWRVSREPILAELPRPFQLWAARWSPDERRVVQAGFGAGIYDATTGALVTSVAYDSARVTDAAWSPDGQRLVLSGHDGFAAIYTADGALAHRLDGHTGNVNGSVFSPDGGRLVTCGSDGAVIIRDAMTGAPQVTLRHPAPVTSATWSHDGALVVTAGWDRTLRVWDVARGEVVREIGGGTTQFLFAALSPDGRTIASTGHDGEVTLWRADTGERARSLEGHTGPATMADWSPDGALLVTSGDDSTSRIWDPETGRGLLVLRHPGAHMQAWWSRDGRRVLTVDFDRGLRVWAVPREDRSVDEIVAASARLSPWRLVGTRLVRDR